MHVVHALAALAADIAAPDELALTALDASHHVRVVSTATAQEVAAIRAGGGAVAVAPPGADDTPPVVLQAVVWRLVEEDELLLVNREPMLILPGLPPGAVHYLNALLVALLQVHAHILKSCHHLPTRLHCAGAGDAMTAAVCGHCTADGLKTAEDTDIKHPADDDPPTSQIKSEGSRDMCVLTCRPTSLLCRFMVLSAYPRRLTDVFFTMLSMNLRLNQVPYWMWSEQPPQCQPSSTEPLPCSRLSQPHSVMLP